MLASGLVEAFGQGLRDLVGYRQPGLVVGPVRSVWARWGDIVAQILAGGLVWGAVWRYDLARGGTRRLRVVFLYIVLILAVPATLGSTVQGLNEILGRLLGRPSELDDVLSFIPGFLVCTHHWAVVRRQVAPRRMGLEGEPVGIPWPRRLGIVLLTVVGLGLTSAALVALIWLALDFTFNTGNDLSGSNWWRDRLSLSVATLLVGIPIWLGGWNHLQHAATAAPQSERTAPERRWALGFVMLASSLLAIGFAVATLWLMLQALLGAGLDSNDVSRMLKQLSSVGVLLVIIGYYGQPLRRDLAFGPARAGAVKVIALVAPGTEEALERLSEQAGRRIEVIGYLTVAQTVEWSDLETLEQLLGELDSDFNSDRLLLLLGPDGGRLHPYSADRP